MVNQPKPPQKPDLEILPPLFPPPTGSSAPEGGAAAGRPARVDEWRQCMRRTWDLSRLEAALEASGDSGDDAPGGMGGEGSGGGEAGSEVRQEENDDGSTTFRF